MALKLFSTSVRSNSPATEQDVANFLENALKQMEDQSMLSEETRDDTFFYLVADRKHNKVYFRFGDKAMTTYNMPESDRIFYLTENKDNSDQLSSFLRIDEANFLEKVPFEQD